MKQYSSIIVYCGTVCEQVRWKKAHANITDELTNHIEDQVDVYKLEGLSEEKAISMTLKEMGDAVGIGSQLDSVHKPKPQWTMIGLIIVILLIGYIARDYAFGQFGYKQSGIIEFFNYGIPTSSIGLLLGIGGMICAYLLDFTFIGKKARLIFMGVLFSGAILLRSSNIGLGRSYINFPFVGNISLIYLSLIFPLAIVALVYSLRSKRYIGIIVSWLGITVLWFIVYSVPAFYDSLQFAVISMIIIMMAIYKGWFNVNKTLGTILSSAPIIGISMILIKVILSREYLIERIKVYFSSSYYKGEIYPGNIIISTRTMIDSSNMIGQGFSGGYESELLSFAYNNLQDSFITYMIYQIGWLPFILLISIFSIFIVMGYKKAFRQKSVLGFMVSMTIMLIFTLQTLMYLIYNLGFQMFVPISLPLISPGNTAMVINLTLIGFMLSVFRNGDEVLDDQVNFTPKKAM